MITDEMIGMTNEQAIEQLRHAIVSLTLTIEELRIRNSVYRLILHAIYRFRNVQDPESERLLEGSIRGIIECLPSGIDENHPLMKLVRDEVASFLAEGNAPAKIKFEVIQGGARERRCGPRDE